MEETDDIQTPVRGVCVRACTRSLERRIRNHSLLSPGKKRSSRGGGRHAKNTLLLPPMPYILRISKINEITY